MGLAGVSRNQHPVFSTTFPANHEPLGRFSPACDRSNATPEPSGKLRTKQPARLARFGSLGQGGPA